MVRVRVGVRVACFDIGSNAIRFLIAEWEGDELRELCIGGEITSVHNALNDLGYIELDRLAPSLEALSKFVMMAKRCGATPVCALATAAIREAKNAGDVIREIEERVGIPVVCLSQDAEARLGFLAALHGMPIVGEGKKVMFADVGGYSTEIVVGDASGCVEFVGGLDFGSGKLTRRFITAYPISRNEREALLSFTLASLKAGVPPFRFCSHLIVSGGTAVALAMLKHGVDHPSTDRLHATILTREEVAHMLEMVANMSLGECESLLKFEPRRAPLFYAGIAILFSLMEVGGFSEAFVSARCLMHGALEKLMRMRVDVTSPCQIKAILNEP